MIFYRFLWAHYKLVSLCWCLVCLAEKTTRHKPRCRFFFFRHSNQRSQRLCRSFQPVVTQKGSFVFHRRVPSFFFYVLRVDKHGSKVLLRKVSGFAKRRDIGWAGLSLCARRFCFVCSRYVAELCLPVVTKRAPFLGIVAGLSGVNWTGTDNRRYTEKRDNGQRYFNAMTTSTSTTTTLTWRGHPTPVAGGRV